MSEDGGQRNRAERPQCEMTPSKGNKRRAPVWYLCQSHACEVLLK